MRERVHTATWWGGQADGGCYLAGWWRVHACASSQQRTHACLVAHQRRIDERGEALRVAFVHCRPALQRRLRKPQSCARQLCESCRCAAYGPLAVCELTGHPHSAYANRSPRNPRTASRVWASRQRVTCRAGRSPAVAATISGVAGRGKCAGTSLRVGICEPHHKPSYPEPHGTPVHCIIDDHGISRSRSSECMGSYLRSGGTVEDRCVWVTMPTS
jgi:hypothetical protein